MTIVKNIRNIFMALIAVITFTFAHESLAQREVGIAAIVGDTAISNIDLEERVRIAMFASNLPKGKGFEEKLLPQVLRGLIDEKLYMKEALNLDVTISPEEINNVVADIEKRNKIQPGKFDEFLKQNGLSSAAMRDQIKSQLTWNKVVTKKIRPQITASDKEVDEAIEHLSKQSGLEEVNISEIFLPVDSTNDDKKIKEIADKFSKQLQQEGGFKEIAKEFSKSTTAGNGGEAGWLKLGQLPDAQISTLKNMRNGEVSNPIRLPEGYIIIMLNGRRAYLDAPVGDADISIRQAVVKVPAGSNAETVKAIEETIKQSALSVKSCDEFPKFAKNIGSNSSTSLMQTKLSSIMPEMADALRNLKAGQISAPIPTDHGIAIFMMCKRDAPKTELALNTKIRDSIMMKKLGIQANRYLRDLRRGAFIEVRI